MGKKRKRSANDLESASSAVQLPSFDESALSALTNKIEIGFRNAAAPGQDPQDRSALRSENTRNLIEGAQKVKSDTEDRVSGKYRRDAQGIAQKQTGGGSKIPKNRVDGHSGKSEGERNVLLQEILALGGTEDDLDLVMGVASDDEDVGENGLEQTSATDPKLKKELSKYIAGLGIEARDIEDSSGAESGEDGSYELEDIYDTSASKLANDVKDVTSSDLRGANNSAKRLKDLVSKSPPLEAGNVVLTQALDVRSKT
jgi:ribosome biogenesis protein MAK21